ncbi:MAG: MFS transporter [Thermoleophilaceae bacterium]
MTTAVRREERKPIGDRLSTAARQSFLSLRVPNYRRYFTGQVVSLSGNWVQIVAEMWLILRLTDSGVAVGLLAALQFAPMLLLGAYGGLLADRFDKRRLLMLTQAGMVVPALTLFALTVTGVVAPWMLFALVFVRGTVNALDNPARQSFVIEMVGADRVVNAVSLNSVIVHCARMVGPAIAGVLIATVGVEPCFLLNAASFAAMLGALNRMEPAELAVTDRAPRRPHALRDGIRYVATTPKLAVPLAMMALVGTLGFNFQVLLPLLARFSFDGGPGTYAALVVAMGAGSVVGALTSSARGRVSSGLLIGSSAAFGASTLLAVAAPTLSLEVIALALVGAASVTFAAGVNSTLQLEVEPAMRGRVMALYSVVFLGSTPFGAPLAGWLAQAASPRAGLALGAVAALVAAAAAGVALRGGAAHERGRLGRVLAVRAAART